MTPTILPNPAEIKQLQKKTGELLEDLLDMVAVLKVMQEGVSEVDWVSHDALLKEIS